MSNNQQLTSNCQALRLLETFRRLLTRALLLPDRLHLDGGDQEAGVLRFGGADRDRTGDPLLAKQVLSQLSYSPLSGIAATMVGLGRFELPTSPLSGVRSNQLSYRPALAAHPLIQRLSDTSSYYLLLKGFEDG